MTTATRSSRSADCRVRALVVADMRKRGSPGGLTGGGSRVHRVALPDTIGRMIAGIARHVPLLRVLDGEAGCLDQLRRCAVAAAAFGESFPWFLEAVLPCRQPRRVGPHVLKEQQASARSEDALDLVEDDDRLVDGAEHERRHHGVHRAVVHGEPLGGRVEDGRGAFAATDGLLQPPAHRGGGLGEDELVEIVGVVGQVQSGAAAQFERAAARQREEVAATRAHPGQLARPQDGVVDGGEQPSPRSGTNWAADVVGDRGHARDDRPTVPVAHRRVRSSASDGRIG